MLGVNANYPVGMAKFQWIAVESAERHLIVSHDAEAAPKAAFDNAALQRILPLVATGDALHAAAIRGTELVMTRFTGTSKDGVHPGAVTVLQKLDAAPAAAAMTLSPDGTAPCELFLALAWDKQDATHVELLTVDCASHKIVARHEQTVPGVRPMGASAVGWSTTGDLALTLLVRSAAKASEIKLAEWRTKADLKELGAATLSGSMILRAPLRDAYVSYFETDAGIMTRGALIRGSDSSEMWAVPQGGEPRKPASPVVSSGPVALLPGRIHWYAVWPERRKLDVGPL